MDQDSKKRVNISGQHFIEKISGSGTLLSKIKTTVIIITILEYSEFGRKGI